MSRIIPILKTYRRERYMPDDKCALRDLLTDVLHYCDANNWDFECTLAAARNVWTEEKLIREDMDLNPGEYIHGQ